MPGGELPHDRVAEQVDDQVALRDATAPGYANGLIRRRFSWAPAAEWWPLTGVLSSTMVPPMQPFSISIWQIYRKIRHHDLR